MRGTRYVDELVERFPILSQCRQDILDSCNIMTDCFQKKGKMLICGNGGSCSDSDHIVGELMKSFEICRPINIDLSRNLEAISDERGKYLSGKLEGGLPVISLSAHAALLSAISNDIDSNMIFAQQVNCYGLEKDILLAISSSGNSQNVIDAIITAKAKKMTVVGLTGSTGGRMKKYCDVTICVPAVCTAEIQEYHLPIYHAICRGVEAELFQ